MGIQQISLAIVFMAYITHVVCNYNRISINNVDVCRENKKKGVREKISKCTFDIFQYKDNGSVSNLILQLN